MAETPMLEFAYWDIRGLAQPIKMALYYGGVEFKETLYTAVAKEDGGYDISSWTNVKPTLGMKHPNLPYIFHGNLKMSQSVACLTYAAEVAGIHDGFTTGEKIRALAYCEHVQDIRNEAVKCFYGFADDKEALARYIAAATAKFAVFEGQMSGDWLLGDKICSADFHLGEMIYQHMLLDESIFADMPCLQEYAKKFWSLPKILEYEVKANTDKVPINNKMAKWGSEYMPPPPCVGVIRLGYWNIRGLAQPIRMLLEYMSTPYIDEQYVVTGTATDFDGSQWFGVKSTLGIDIPNLPYIVHKDISFSQSVATLTYAAQASGLHDGFTPQEEAEALAYCEHVQDMRNAAVACFYVFFGDTPIPEYKKAVAGRLKTFESYLESEDSWLLGEKLCSADFHLAEMIYQHMLLDMTLLKDCPKLVSYAKRFFSIPSVINTEAAAAKQKMCINNIMAKWGATYIPVPEVLSTERATGGAGHEKRNSVPAFLDSVE